MTRSAHNFLTAVAAATSSAPPAVASSSSSTSQDGFKIGTRVVGKIKKNLNATGVIVAIADSGRVEVQWDHIPEISTVTTRAIAVLADDEDPSKQPSTATTTGSNSSIVLKKSGLFHDVAEVNFEKNQAYEDNKRAAANRKLKRKAKPFPTATEGDDDMSTDEEEEHVTLGHDGDRHDKKHLKEEISVFEGEVIDPSVSFLFYSFTLC